VNDDEFRKDLVGSDRGLIVSELCVHSPGGTEENQQNLNQNRR
jgi:hypothetical protein